MLCFSHVGMANDYSLPGIKISPLYYWIESDGRQHSVAEALEDAEWVEVEGEFNLGYNYQSSWFMQDIQAFIKEDWIFQVPYPLLDNLDLYLFKGDELILEVQTGDAVPFSQKALRVHDFILGLSVNEPSNYRLVGRIETQGTLMLPIKWQTEKDYAENLAVNQMIYGIYYGVLMIMALYHLFIYFVIRERGYLFYVLSVSAFILLQLAFDGRGFSWIWPEYPILNKYSFPFTYALYQLAIFTFIVEFLKLKESSPNLYRYFVGLRVLVLCLMPLIFILPYNSIVPVVVIVGVTGFISGLLTSAYLWIKGFTAARYFTCAWALFLAGIILLNFRGLGIGETNILSQYGYVFGSILEVLFLAFSLADRINSVNREKRKTERALIKSQNEHVLALQRYQDLYESSPIGNFQADKRYQLISVNDACGHLFGFENPEDMLGEVKDIRSYLESDFSDFQNIVREARDKGAVYNQEIHIKDHKDSERWLSISMRFNNDEGVEIFEGSVQEVTERKNAEKLRIELDRERMHIMEQFSIGIAKEINTPLGSNVATTAFIRESLDDVYQIQQDGTAEIKDYEGFVKLAHQSLGLLESNQKRITKVVKRFREVSAQHLGLKESHFVLADIINEAVENKRWKMAGWRVHMICSTDIRLHSYSKAISVIISQLIENALIHSLADKDQDPKIWIRAEKNTNEELTITFSDNGQGIKKEMAKNLCQPFFTTKRGPEGHIGLGLYMVYNLVTRSLNGRILFPITGSGFSVQFKIPLDVTDQH
jgi:PAS domain S-box-containing protein